VGLNEIIKAKREDILRVAREHGAYNVRLFGSALHGEENAESDVDFLVDLEPGRSLFDHASLTLDLEELLGRKVDVVTENSLYWILKRKILREAKAL
jgi:uncharacterized protein